MSLQRSFSFDENDDTSYHRPSQQTQQAQRRAQGYQVASGTSYIPNMSQLRRSPSPTSSQRSASPPSALRGQGPYAQQAPPGGYPGYSIPMQETTQGRVSEYRRQRLEDTAPTNVSPPRSRQLPAVPAQAQVSLDGQSHSIPLPPPHTRSLSARDQSAFHPYTDRSPSRERRPPSPSYRVSASPERHDLFLSPPQGRHGRHQSNDSMTGLTGAAAPPAVGLDYARPTPGRLHTDHSGYADSSTSAAFRGSEVDVGGIDPANLEDDDDDPFSTLESKKNKRGFHHGAAIGTGAAAGAAGAGVGGYFKNLAAGRDTSGQYGQVPGGVNSNAMKQSSWLSKQQTGNKRVKWMVTGLIALVIILAIVGGVVGVIVSKKSSSSSLTTSTITPGQNSGLTSTSPQIKALMNNDNLHKVFPGIDYTPQDVQYPGCLTTPPSQDSVTEDVAVLSQLTPVIRLYGTDCNQTEMVLAALDALKLKDDVKLWAGVWLDTNTTTNIRQMNQWWDIVEKYGAEPFIGVIVGNEVLFRKDMTETQLVDTLDEVRQNLTSKSLSSLKLATSDLGSSWTANLAAAVDVVMSNVHPFFGGVAAPQAASWTWSYWQETDVIITGNAKEQIIAETGWPSAGGNDCTNGAGANVKCSSATAGAVAGIPEMNTFMSEWVCTALTNGTQYFWFEAFDEPWKVIFNTPGEDWEDKWGLMDVNRQLKPGVQVPNCNGLVAQLPS